MGVRWSLALANSFGEELSDMADFGAIALCVETSSQVHDATLVIGDDGVRAGRFGIT